MKTEHQGSQKLRKNSSEFPLETEVMLAEETKLPIFSFVLASHLTVHILSCTLIHIHTDTESVVIVMSQFYWEGSKRWKIRKMMNKERKTSTLYPHISE